MNEINYKMKDITERGIEEITIPYTGMILSNKFSNCIIDFDNNIHHEDNFSKIIRDHYMEEYLSFIDKQEHIHFPDSNKCIDGAEMLFSVFLASINEGVILNASDQEDTDKLIKYKKELYSNGRTFYNFGLQIYLPNHIKNISEVNKQLLYSLREYFDLLDQSCPVEILLVPSLEKLENEKLELIHLEEMYEKLENEKTK